MRIAPEIWALTAAQFQGLADVPPELEWFANIANARTGQAYKQAITELTAFMGMQRPEEFRPITRAHVIAWRKDLERRGLAGSMFRRKLLMLSLLFDYLCEHHAVTHNPVKADG